MQRQPKENSGRRKEEGELVGWATQKQGLLQFPSTEEGSLQLAFLTLRLATEEGPARLIPHPDRWSPTATIGGMETGSLCKGCLGGWRKRSHSPRGLKLPPPTQRHVGHWPGNKSLRPGLRLLLPQAARGHWLWGSCHNRVPFPEPRGYRENSFTSDSPPRDQWEPQRHEIN